MFSSVLLISLIAILNISLCIAAAYGVIKIHQALQGELKKGMDYVNLRIELITKIVVDQKNSTQSTKIQQLFPLNK